MTRIKLTNVVRHRREYRADIELDGRVIGYVEREQSDKMLGYRAGTYRAKLSGERFVVAQGDTLAELREELRQHLAAEHPDARDSW